VVAKGQWTSRVNAPEAVAPAVAPLSVNRSGCYPWQTLARCAPPRMASTGGQLEPLNRLHAEATIGIDASEINGPVWSVSGRGTAGPLDRVAQIAERNYCRPQARPFRLGFPRKVPVFPICSPAAL